MRLSLLVFLPALLAGCDGGLDPSYAVEVLSVTETRYDERGTLGLAFEVANAGSHPLYYLEVTVVPAPPPRPNAIVHHAAQAVAPVEPGATVVIEVPLSGWASHDDYDCYRYDIAGFDEQDRGGPQLDAALYERYGGTCTGDR